MIIHLDKLIICCQVYIVAMIGNGSAPGCVSTNSCSDSLGEDDGEFGEFEFRGESLLTLVQPELVSLSQHWLAALKDHALLSLPPGNSIIEYYFPDTFNSTIYPYKILKSFSLQPNYLSILPLPASSSELATLIFIVHCTLHTYLDLYLHGMEFSFMFLEMATINISQNKNFKTMGRSKTSCKQTSFPKLLFLTRELTALSHIQHS